jgi:hypothetical protein
MRSVGFPAAFLPVYRSFRLGRLPKPVKCRQKIGTKSSTSVRENCRPVPSACLENSSLGASGQYTTMRQLATADGKKKGHTRWQLDLPVRALAKEGRHSNHRTLGIEDITVLSRRPWTRTAFSPPGGWFHQHFNTGKEKGPAVGISL